MREPREERASVLLLVPAAVLVLVVLAAVAVDSAAVFLGQRDLANAAAAAATDATSAISQSAFYDQGVVELDPAAAREVVDASLASQDLHGVALRWPPEVQVSGAQVCVALSGTVQPIFGRAFPRLVRPVAVSARATATAAGAPGTPVPRRRIC